jgi:hypothetical protein
MSTSGSTDFELYNSFCHNVNEGSILYNIDSTNSWGEYLLVVNKQTIHIDNIKTYTLLLLGLKKEEGQYKPRNIRISITPDYAKKVLFLKQVGYCKYDLLLSLSDVNVNVGLVTVYGSTDLHKYSQKLHIRKPQRKMYGNDGSPIIKKLNN